MIRPAAILATTVLLWSCLAPPSDAEEMYQLAASTKHVASAVEALTRWGSSELDGDALLNAAVKDQPAIMAPFAKYHVSAKRQERHSVVLVCDRERKQALVEDAGCTVVRMDAERWKTPSPCAFTLDLAQLCK